MTEAWTRAVFAPVPDAELAAYGEFVGQYALRVCASAYAIVGTREGANEIAKRVFVRAWFASQGHNLGRSPYAWLYRIVVSECYSFRHTNHRKAGAEYGPGRAPSDRVVLNNAIERIPEEERCLLLLRELEGYSVQRLSEDTGLGESVICRRLLSARQQLAKDWARREKP